MEHNLTQKAYTKSFVVFGLPVLSNDYDDLLIKIKMLKYNTGCIQFRQFNRSNHFNFMPIESIYRPIQAQAQTLANVPPPLARTPVHPPPVHAPIVPAPTPIMNQNTLKQARVNREAIFKIKPDIQNDIYHLYCSDGQLYETACIPDYVTSVMMNNLFRDIKENKNLDALEESDDEDEFQNENADRFVFLDKEYNMLCAYNYKFRKWYPLRLANANMKLVNRNDLKMNVPNSKQQQYRK
jgi:hypothetical protein